MERAGEALNGGDARAAARACQKILTDNPRHVEARYLHGRCLAALGHWPEAACEFRRVLEARADFFAALVDLGIAETLAGNYAVALTVLERACLIDRRPAPVHFGLGLCRLGLGQPGAAVQAFRDAIARNPAFPDAVNNLGVAHDRLGQQPEAAECFRRAVAMRADYADAHRNLGDCLRRLGDADGAVAALQRAAQLQPQDASLAADLGGALLESGDTAAAAKWLERALQLDPNGAGAAANLGEALRLLNEPVRAEAAFNLALARDPSLAEAHLGRGRLALARGDDTVAAASLLAAASNAPRNNIKVALATAADLEELGNAAEALALLQTAAAARPDAAELHDAMGALEHRQGHLPEALDHYDRALELDGERISTLLKSGQALESMGAAPRAIACFQKVLRLAPEHAQALASIASCAFRLCDWDVVEDMLARLRAAPDGFDELPSFLMLSAGMAPQELAQSLRRRARAMALPSPLPMRATERAAGGGERLRIAYVSPDFRTHPVGFAIAGVIERHDRARISTLGISLKVQDGSAQAIRFRNAFDEFIDASSLSNRDVVRLMRERGVQVALDIAGLTTSSRTAIFAMRAAPVQVNYLGFPGSMGLDCMDYIIADRIVIPESQESLYAERVLRMPHSYLPFDDSRRLAAEYGGREAAGLPAQGVVFCAFNNSYKITRTLFELWMGLLREFPDSVLWLRDLGPAIAANLRNAALAHGIAAERLIFAPFEHQPERHLARLQHADLFLDTLPYNAHTTAQEALWAGVPVVSCRGENFAGRVGASILSACGLDELICADLVAYRACAAEIAASLALRERLRRQLRHGAATAPAFDTERYARDLETVLYRIAPCVT
jgi:protein O-GlcNAc transferase